MKNSTISHTHRQTDRRSEWLPELLSEPKREKVTSMFRGHLSKKGFKSLSDSESSLVHRRSAGSMKSKFQISGVLHCPCRMEVWFVWGSDSSLACSALVKWCKKYFTKTNKWRPSWLERCLFVNYFQSRQHMTRQNVCYQDSSAWVLNKLSPSDVWLTFILIYFNPRPLINKGKP